MVDLFRTRDHVADFDGYVSQFVTRSAATRATLRGQLDVAYGEGQDEKLDLFFPEGLSAPAPVHLVVHGGYWRMFAKADYSFIADTITQAGAIAAIMDYSLMPSVRMETIVDQVTRAASWLYEHAGEFGGDPARFSVSGHSAGAHLCAMLLEGKSPFRPNAGLLLSGVYDIEPLRQSFLQPLIGITEEEAARFSPLRLSLEKIEDVRILVGDGETEPFHTQAASLAHKLGTTPVQISGNHMSVVLDLGDASSPAGRHLWSMCSRL
ncbi:alpha/beta hydrolase [Devosia rhizoryzae]|uniref:Alpha/beta hydrolase n=1 Tax=Devosia rhizoryzae TaxID=2774137 RepID=A0ABX7C4X5_9HYPH|nr:alpha/beta hydrolase [Devosia rhizoryzae]QQR38289.1 alpha/beta hydrolase [Devosia rhizoryzae]